MESIFTTKHLEKTPTAKVVKFVPNSEVDCNYLSPEEEQILQKTLHRLAERVREITIIMNQHACLKTLSLSATIGKIGNLILLTLGACARGLQ